MLLLRLCLVLAILAGIGVIVVSQAVLKPQIQVIIDKRDTHEKNWKTAVTVTNKLNRELKDTQVKLKSTEENLDTTKTALASTTKQLEEETKRSNDRSMAIEKLKSELKGMSDKLAAWEALGYTVDQIAGVIKQLKEFKSNNEALLDENKLFKARIDRLEREIADLRGSGEDPVMPASARGRVLVVDPKWDFLVLDVGSKLGLKDKGVLLVSRNGALIAKVRVMNVQPDRSIANIMPGWKLKDVMEGDQVFPFAPANTL
jgi:septal ring factor EnvC (AmiA/AmiB activator)